MLFVPLAIFFTDIKYLLMEFIDIYYVLSVLLTNSQLI